MGRLPKYHHPETTLNGSPRNSVQLLKSHTKPETWRCYCLAFLTFLSTGGYPLAWCCHTELCWASFSRSHLLKGKVKSGEIWSVQAAHALRVSAISAVGKWFKITRFGWGWFLEKIMWFSPTSKHISEKENLGSGWRDCKPKCLESVFLDIKRENLAQDYSKRNARESKVNLWHSGLCWPIFVLVVVWQEAALLSASVG